LSIRSPLVSVGAVADKVFIGREVQRMIDQSGENFAVLAGRGVHQPA
jgi:hypothetical protein